MPFTPKGSQQASPGQSESGSIWDPRGDVDDDGDVDLTDRTLYMSKDNNWPPQSSSTVVAQAFSDVGNPFMHQGRPHFAIDTAASDTEGKLMLNDHRARFNDPVTGRWVTRDPLDYNRVLVLPTVPSNDVLRNSREASPTIGGLAPSDKLWLSIHSFPAQIDFIPDDGLYIYRFFSSSPTRRFDPSGYIIIPIPGTCTPTQTGAGNRFTPCCGPLPGVPPAPFPAIACVGCNWHKRSCRNDCLCLILPSGGTIPCSFHYARIGPLLCGAGTCAPVPFTIRIPGVTIPMFNVICIVPGVIVPAAFC